MIFKNESRVTYSGTANFEGSGRVIEEGFNDRRVQWDDGTYSWERLEDLVAEEPPLAPWEQELLWTPFEQNVRRHTNKIADLLIAKNKAYGDSALNPVRVFSKASRIEQLNVRIDDKISRIQRGTDFEDEDTVRDLIGYLLLRLIAEESE